MAESAGAQSHAREGAQTEPFIKKHRDDDGCCACLRCQPKARSPDDHGSGLGGSPGPSPESANPPEDHKCCACFHSFSSRKKKNEPAPQPQDAAVAANHGSGQSDQMEDCLLRAVCSKVDFDNTPQADEKAPAPAPAAKEKEIDAPKSDPTIRLLGDYLLKHTAGAPDGLTEGKYALANLKAALDQYRRLQTIEATRLFTYPYLNWPQWFFPLLNVASAVLLLWFATWRCTDKHKPKSSDVLHCKGDFEYYSLALLGLQVLLLAIMRLRHSELIVRFADLASLAKHVAAIDLIGISQTTAAFLAYMLEHLDVSVGATRISIFAIMTCSAVGYCLAIGYSQGRHFIGTVSADAKIAHKAALKAIKAPIIQRDQNGHDLAEQSKAELKLLLDALSYTAADRLRNGGFRSVVKWKNVSEENPQEACESLRKAIQRVLFLNFFVSAALLALAIFLAVARSSSHHAKPNSAVIGLTSAQFVVIGVLGYLFSLWETLFPIVDDYTSQTEFSMSAVKNFCLGEAFAAVIAFLVEHVGITEETSRVLLFGIAFLLVTFQLFHYLMNNRKKGLYEMHFRNVPDVEMAALPRKRD